MEEWTCNLCTFVNKAGLQCSVCCNLKPSASGKWRCSKCTCENDAKSQTCNVCENPKVPSKKSNPPSPPPIPPLPTVPRPIGPRQKSPEPRQPKPPSSPAPIWPCPICTLKNNYSAPKCSACDTPNPNLQGPSSPNFENIHNNHKQQISTAAVKVLPEKAEKSNNIAKSNDKKPAKESVNH